MSEIRTKSAIKAQFLRPSPVVVTDPDAVPVRVEAQLTPPREVSPRNSISRAWRTLPWPGSLGICSGPTRGRQGSRATALLNRPWATAAGMGVDAAVLISIVRARPLPAVRQFVECLMLASSRRWPRPEGDQGQYRYSIINCRFPGSPNDYRMKGN